MRSGEASEAISARATGALFFTGFGSLWLCTGLMALHRFNIVTGTAVAIVAAALAAAALRLLRLGAKAPQEQGNAEAKAEATRVFRRVNTLQWIGVFAVIVLANVFRQPQFIIPGISIVVGLHLFPLARLFHYPMHYLTGALLVLWSAGVVILLPRDNIASVGALGTAAILLSSAIYTLVVATRAAR